ncbi:MAG: NADH-quinone oxidoreductase subunit C [Desulfobacterales bacterium]|nr:MAG: NADH-quinone oxidoreductase subunit C [Desulfobacterales bacterium]
MQGDIIAVGPETLVREAAQAKVDGYRLVTLSCVELDAETVDILYHFDKDLTLKHLRLTVPKGTPVPSISAVHWAAFLAENEIQDLFGLHFTGLAVDYEGTLYLEDEVRRTPFCRYSIRQSDKNTPAPDARQEMGEN